MQPKQRRFLRWLFVLRASAREPAIHDVLSLCAPATPPPKAFAARCEPESSPPADAHGHGHVYGHASDPNSGTSVSRCRPSSSSRRPGR